MRRVLWRLILCTLSWLSQSSHAACAASAATSPATVSFGSLASQTFTTGGISPNGSVQDATFSVTCSIALSLGLLSNSSTWLRMTAQQPLTMSNGTDSISYIIASNSTYTPSISAQNGSIGGPSGFNLITLGLLTLGRVDIPLHIATTATSIWPSAGTYTGTQTLLVDGTMCVLLSVGNVCIGSNPVNSTVTMNLSLTVSKSCEFISTPTSASFGQVSFLENAGTIQLSAILRCTKSEDYAFYLDNGDNFSGGVRHLKSPTGTLIQYDVLQPNSTQILNSSNPLSRIGTGLDEALAIPLKITNNQSTPAAAIYSDNIRMVIEY